MRITEPALRNAVAACRNAASGGGSSDDGCSILLSRRTACAAGLAMFAVPFFATGQAKGQRAMVHPIRFVVTDRRYVQSLSFAESLTDRGVERLEVTEGLTRLWRDQLTPLWRERGGALCGLTRTETWSGIAEQARAVARRSILAAHHTIFEGQDAAAHSVSAAGLASGTAAALRCTGQWWPRAMAEIVSNYRQPAFDVAGHRQSAPSDGVSVSLALTSWIIA